MKTARILLLIATTLASAVLVRAEVRPVSPETLDRAVQDASRLAAGREDMSLVRVQGVSMLPYFGEGAVLVIKRTESDKLREGQIVVYKNRFGETIVHRIIGRTADGWTVKGYNNNTADTTPVSDANLIGVVYATFLSNGSVNDTTVANAGEALPMLALAGPAR